MTKPYTIGEPTELALNKPEESANETAAFLRSLDLVPIHADPDEYDHLIISSPPRSPALPEGDEIVSPTDLSDDTIILPVEESQVSPADESDDTIILPAKEPQVPQYIIQQQKLIKCELIVKITKLSDSDINAHSKRTQPPTARKRNRPG